MYISDRSQHLLILVWGVIVFVVILIGIPKASFGEVDRSKGQTIYLSVIPQIQSGKRKNVSYLGLLMVLRNTSLTSSATIRSIIYHNAHGQLEKEILAEPLTLAPLSSHSLGFHKKELGLQEGMSSCMIVKWDAGEKISPVLVEGIVIGTGTGWTSGMVFKGVVVDEID